MFNIEKVRADFPILSREVYGKPLVDLDNAATTQKPRLVVDALVDEYFNVNANVHRKRPTISSSPVAPPKASIWWPPRFVTHLCMRVMR